MWLTRQILKVGGNDVADEVIRGLWTRHQSPPPGGIYTRTQSAKARPRKRKIEEEREQVRVRGARRSKNWGKCGPAVKHADAKNWASAGRKLRKRRENGRGKIRESNRMKLNSY